MLKEIIKTINTLACNVPKYFEKYFTKSRKSNILNFSDGRIFGEIFGDLGEVPKKLLVTVFTRTFYILAEFFKIPRCGRVSSKILWDSTKFISYIQPVILKKVTF